MVISKTDKLGHDKRVRRHHVAAINIVKSVMEDAEGRKRQLLEKSERYHLAMLHHQWFPLGRRENENFIARHR